MPTRKPAAKTASVGVTRTQLYVEEELGWLFRRQIEEDYGIDAHVEVVDGDEVRGRLLALQIKSGESWFNQPAVGGWWYRPDDDHVRYWKRNSLPVAIVLYNPVSKLCHWQLVTDTSLERSKTGGWKVLVPEAHVLNADAAASWRTAAEGDSYELRLRELRLARPWMKMLDQGTRLIVDFEEWINKSSGRGTISIGVDNEDGNDPEELVTWHLLLGPASYAEAVPKLFAWADADIHVETYDYAEDDEGDRGREGRQAMGIRPYKNVAGEVDYYRLELELNALGRSFLIVDGFASNGVRQMTPR